MPNEEIKIELEYYYVVKRSWAPNDTYLVVSLGDVQLFERTWKEGDKVKVTVQIERV